MEFLSEHTTQEGSAFREVSVERVPLRDEFVQEYIRDRIIAPWIKESPRTPFTMVDYLCGDGLITKFFQEVEASVPEKMVQTIGYDPKLRVKRNRRHKRMESRGVHPPIFVDTLDGLTRVLHTGTTEGEKGKEIEEGMVDVLLLHFALHNLAETGDELQRAVNDLLETFQPRRVVFGEYDYTGVTFEQFAKNFLLTEAARKEVDETKNELIADGKEPDAAYEEALRICYDIHARFGSLDYKNVFNNSSHYRVTRRIAPYSGSDPHPHELFFVAFVAERQGMG